VTARLFVLLVAIFLIAAPVDRVLVDTCPDVAAERVACDEVLPAAPLVAPPACPATVATSESRRLLAPPEPMLAGIFRPPRTERA